MNSVTLIGNLGADPETTALPSGTKVSSFRVAVGDVYGTGDNKTEKTYWFSCKTFGKLAEIVEQHLSKGSRIGLHGKLIHEEWEKDGQKKSAVRIIADRIDFLSWKTSQGEELQPF